MTPGSFVRKCGKLYLPVSKVIPTLMHANSDTHVERMRVLQEDAISFISILLLILAKVQSMYGMVHVSHSMALAKVKSMDRMVHVSHSMALLVVHGSMDKTPTVSV